MRNKATYIMLFVGLFLQVVSFLITKDAWLSFISGISGVFAVVYCSERKVSYYVWSLIQMVTFTIICWETQLYGKLIENAFNFVTMIIGVFIWLRHLDYDDKVVTKALTYKQKILLSMCTIIGWFVLYCALCFFNGNMPMLDSTTTTLAFVAQILMIFRYKESWILWGIIDIICVVIWSIEGNWCIVAQYVFWIINAVYGYVIWEKYEER
jgi:nicotinamide mononucleotide transporter